MTTPATKLAEDQKPSVTVYAFKPPKPGARTGVKDLDGEGQAALIDTLSRPGIDGAALKKLLASPLEGDGSGGAVDKTQLGRTIVISIRKGPASMPGDRLMRTVVTLRPHAPPSAKPPFEFAGYSVAATDTKVQSIARLETSSSSSLSAGAEPGLGPLGDGSVGAELSHSRKTAADIVQQYENLGIDIMPTQLVITRESERGLDVVGNTLVALTLVPLFDTDRVVTSFLAKDVKIHKDGAPLPATAASMSVVPVRSFARCPLLVDVELSFQLRRIEKGREFYTEGKQVVELFSETMRFAEPQTLVRADDAAEVHYVIRHGNYSVMAAAGGAVPQLLVFDDLAQANSFARWLSSTPASRIGATGPDMMLKSDGTPLAKGKYHAEYYMTGCPSAGAKAQNTAVSAP